MTNNIDTSEFVLKTKYGTDKPDLEKEIRDTSGIVKKLDHNVKITEIENRTPTIIGLATTSALTADENKISVSSLVKKKKNNNKTRISEIEKKLSNYDHDKYIATPKFNNLAARVFTARFARANLVTKTDFLWQTEKSYSKNYLK